jgi:hypothetical protein
VAEYNDMATAAEIYYRDYADLATDTGGACVGGIARPSDRRLADQYYQEWLRYRDLQRQAQEQVEAFRIARETAEGELTILQEEQEIVSQELAEINNSIANTQEEIEAKEEELELYSIRVSAIEELIQQTQEVLEQLIVIEELNLAQAQLEQEIAANRQEGIDLAVETSLERERLEIERQREETIAKIERLNQLETQEELETALNQLRANFDLEAIELELSNNSIYPLEKLATLSADLDAIEQRPDLPEELKVLLAQTQASIHQALLGEEAKTIETQLNQVAKELILQLDDYGSAIKQLQAEKESDLLLQQTAETDLQAAIQELLEQNERAEELGQSKDELVKQNQEVLYEIAFANPALEISQQLAEQSKDILNQIIQQRIEEREIRQNSFINSIFGTVSTVLSIISFIPSPVSLALQLASATVGAVQAAYNEDWLGAVFKAAMGVANFVGNSIKAAQTANNPPASVLGMSMDTANEVLSHINTYRPIASGVYGGLKGLEAIDNGDEIGGFLTILSELSTIAIDPLEDFLPDGTNSFSYQIVNSLQEIPLLIHTTIQAVEDENWLQAIESSLNGVTRLGKNLSQTLSDDEIFETLNHALNNINLVGNISLEIIGAIEEDSLSGWLTGIEGIIESWTSYEGEEQVLETQILNRQIANILGNPEEINKLKEKYQVEVEFENETLLKKASEFKVTETTNGRLLTLGDIDGNKPTFVISHGFNSSTASEWMSGLALSLKEKYGDVNLVLVDWSEDANDFYPTAAGKTKFVGEQVASQLHSWGINLEQTTVIGHSLGSHIAGAIGSYGQTEYNQKLGKIIALDPASPSFETVYPFLGDYTSDDQRLDNTDAKEVEVIHSHFKGFFHLGYENQAGTPGKGYKPTPKGLEILTSNDIFLTEKMLEGYTSENGGGSNHSDAIAFLIDYTLSNSATVQDFFDTKHLQIESLTNNSGDSPGKNKITSIIGSVAPDIFSLGNHLTSFFNDEDNGESGINDYALIQDFEIDDDLLQLHGDINDYLLKPTTGELPDGIGIYLKTGVEDELIAIIEGIEDQLTARLQLAPKQDSNRIENISNTAIGVIDVMDFDIDGNGKVDALTDGILMIRYLAGFTDEALIDGAVGIDATRTNAEDIINYLKSANTMLDIDGSGEGDALTDGILGIRSLAGFTDDALINGAIGTDATRSNATAIKDYIHSFFPPVLEEGIPLSELSQPLFSEENSEDNNDINSEAHIFANETDVV